MTDRDQIAAGYDAGAEYEFSRLAKGPCEEAEMQLTVDLLNRYIAPGSAVADVGAGPGRYAELLLRRGCRVGLVDLSQRSLQHFRDRVGDAFRDQILFTKTACATRLEGIDTGSLDAVLLMGPLYHLTDQDERRAAVAEARRILKIGGYVFAAFISPYPRLMRLLDGDPPPIGDAGYMRDLLERGITRTRFENQTVEQFRCWPHQARELMEQGGFTTVAMRNLEGVASFLSEEEELVLQDAGVRAEFFSVLRSMSENPDLLGATRHFVHVGRNESTGQPSVPGDA